MLLERLRRRLRHTQASGRHPTPRQAYDALSQGCCLYAPVTRCSGPLFAAGLRSDDDDADVLVCRAHYGRLRAAKPGELDTLHRKLVKAFIRPGEHAA
jgi:hypothetical protein